MFAYYFAPRNHIASLRAGCFAKFLPENGWLPTVVCNYWGPEQKDYNPGIIGELDEHIAIHRIKAVKPHGIVRRFVSRKLRPYISPGRCPHEWWHQAGQRASDLIRRERYDAIWATSDPLVPLEVAASVAAKADIPLVADIRDSFNAQQFGAWYKRPFNARSERRLCRSARAVVTVSTGLANALERCLKKPVTVIPNGFDPTLLPSCPPPVDAERFTLLYSGNINPKEQNPEPLFEALALCSRQGRIESNRVKVVFLGSRLEDLKRCVKKQYLDAFAEVLPSVAHNEVLNFHKRSAALLSFTHPGTRGIPTTKIFDYLASGRPILAVPDDRGDVSEILKATGAGVSRSGAGAIADTLAAWYASWLADRQFRLNCNEGAIAEYSRRKHTRQLASLLDSLQADGENN